MVMQAKKLRRAMYNFKLTLMFECVDLLNKLSRLLLEKCREMIGLLEDELEQERKYYESA